MAAQVGAASTLHPESPSAEVQNLPGPLSIWGKEAIPRTCLSAEPLRPEVSPSALASHLSGRRFETAAAERGARSPVGAGPATAEQGSADG